MLSWFRACCGTVLAYVPVRISSLVPFTAIAILAAGCTKQMQFEQQLAQDLSADVLQQPLVAAVPGWGGDYGPFVNLWSGNLFLDVPLLAVPALGFDWDLDLYYNALLAHEVTMVGAGWRFSYDIRLEIDVPVPGSITVRWGDGRRDVFDWDGSGWAGPPSLLGSRITVLGGGGWVLRTKHGLRYEFNTAARLAALLDRNGNAMVLTYAGNLLVRLDDATGRTCFLAYNASDQLVGISGLPAATLTLDYTGTLLVRVRDAAGNPTEFQYDGSDRLRQIQDAAGVAMTVDYHPSATAVARVAVAGTVRNFHYNHYALTTTVSDLVSGGRMCHTAYALDGNGLCVAVRNDMGTTANAYDPATLVLTSHTDTNGRSTTWAVDAQGNVLAVTDPTGASVSFAYDPLYSITVQAQDAAGNTWNRTLDANGNVTQVTNPVGSTLDMTYSPQGQVVQARTPRGNVTLFAYDAHGNLGSVTDPTGATTSAVYDARGKPVSYTEANGQTTTLAWDVTDRLNQIVRPLGSTIAVAWTAVGRLASFTDPTGATTSYAYNPQHLLESQVDAGGGATVWVRDPAGAILAVTDPVGHSEFFTLDVFGRTVAVLDAEGQTWLKTPAPGDLSQYAQITDPTGVTAVFTYTPRYEMERAVWPGPIENIFTFDANGRVQAAVRHTPGEPSIGYTRAYNAAGWLVAETATHLGRTATYTYDADGNVTGVGDNLRPAGTLSVAWDSRNAPLSLSTASPAFSVAIAATPRRDLSSLAYSNGVTAAYSHDAHGNLKTITNTSPSFSASYLLDYDARDHLQHAAGTTPATGAFDVTLARDPSGRVLVESHPPLALLRSYGFDLAGNRQSLAEPPNPPESYLYSPGNRLNAVATVAGTIALLWDARGYVTRYDEIGTVLDLLHRADGSLKSITQNGQTWSFQRGPFGELARVTLPAGTDVWIAEDRSPRGLLRRSEFGAIAVSPNDEYLFVPGGVVMMRTGSQPVVWNRVPFATLSTRVPLAGLHGNAQTASASALISDEFRDVHGRLLQQLGTLFPRLRHRGTDEFRDLKVALSGTSRSVRAGASDIAYSPRTGAMLAYGGVDEACDPGDEGEECRSGCTHGEDECCPGHPAVAAGYASERRAWRGCTHGPDGCCTAEVCTDPSSGVMRGFARSTSPEWGWVSRSTGTESYYVWVPPPPRARLPGVADYHRRRGVGMTRAMTVEEQDWFGPGRGGRRAGPRGGSDGGDEKRDDPPPPYPDPVATTVGDMSEQFSFEALRALLSALGHGAILARIP